MINLKQFISLKEKLNKDPYHLQYEGDDVRDNKELILMLMPGSNDILRFCSARLCNDKDVVYKAVEEDGANLEFASDRLKNSKKLVSMAIQKHGYPISDASEKLKADRSIGLLVANYYPRGIQYLSEELKNDKDLVLAAYIKHASSAMSDEMLLIGKALWEEIGDNDPIHYLTSLKLYNEINEKIEDKEPSKIKKIKI